MNCYQENKATLSKSGLLSIIELIKVVFEL